jgi:MSHA biogenesis protein MshK
MIKRPVFSYSWNSPNAGRSGTGFECARNDDSSGLKRWLPLLLALGWSAAWAGVLSDPTLPPPAWLAATQSAGGAAALNQDASAGVQLILIGPSRKLALINGQTVKPGEAYNGSKVLAIKPGEVVVQDASKSLKLTPAIEKKAITSAPLKKPRGAVPKRKNSANENGGSQ